MKDSAIATLTAEYLNNLALLTRVPHLITRYRCGAQAVLEKFNSPGQTTRACPKCLLQPYETKLQTSIQPQVKSKVIHKYSKIIKTKYQIQKAKQRSRLDQQLVVKCSTCQHIVKKPIFKPLKEPKETKVIILETPVKKKKKKKNKTAGINEAAVKQVQQETRIITADIAILDATPKKKRKHEDVIVIEDSPVPPKKKSKKNQENLMLQQNNKNNNKVDIKTMKQQAQDVEDARKTLDPLSTKKEKKKLKHKLKKLKDSIKNIEIQNNKPKSSLQNFLSTLSV